jgi:membrane protein YqaA with SNARE-associated domain
MGRFVHGIEALALSLGAPGLFLVAFLDSSLLSLPEIADLLVIWMVTRHERLLILYAASATAGSLVGCLLLYYLGRKGGDALIRRRFGTGNVDSALRTFQRYGVMAVLIPSLLPPPAPFKIFVLLAGVADITVTRFTVALTVGRGARYFGEGLLAVWYGERAITFVRDNGATVSLALAGLLGAGLIAWIVWAKSRAQERR